ncbi:MAG: DUF2249 domain-containing protein [Thermodesulfobacteriota bacterium]
MENVLNVRELVPKERHPKIFDTFKALAPGESFILVNDHEPRPLLYQFQNEHDGEFEWWYLEQGPEVWRVVIERRKVADPNRTVTDYFGGDHSRLDKIYDRFQDEYKAGRWEEAATDFKAFRLGLKRHIKAEEEILFPTFEQKTGMVDAGPTFVMRMEHKDIHDYLDRVLAATEARDEEKTKEAAAQLTNLLADHNMKEEHILYPESDSFLEESERADVVKKAQAT